MAYPSLHTVECRLHLKYTHMQLEKLFSGVQLMGAAILLGFQPLLSMV